MAWHDQAGLEHRFTSVTLMLFAAGDYAPECVEGMWRILQTNEPEISCPSPAAGSQRATS